MFRIALCTAALLGFGAVASADELDQEFAPKTTPAAPVATAPAGGTELDSESPQAAHGWRGGWGYGYGYGSGFYGYGRGFGYTPVAYSAGFYRPYYGGFGFGYSPGFYRSSYVSTGFYGGFGGYRSFYSYGGYGGYGGFGRCWW
jgi:hypothetical protein